MDMAAGGTFALPATRMQRVQAAGAIAVSHRRGATRLDRLYQDAAAKIRIPRGEGSGLEAVLINTAGGLTGGDRLGWTVSVGAGADCVVTTQACEKVYRAEAGHAGVSVAIDVAEGGRLAWLPQESILFDRSALVRRLDADIAPGARALFCESALFGRAAMGEAVSTGLYRDRWRIRRAGQIVHAEDLAIGGEVAALLARTAVAGGSRALATVLLVADDAVDMLDPARALVGERGGVSAWEVAGSGKLLARLHDEDGYCLRKRLIPLLSLLNGRAPLPKSWSL